MNFAEHLKSQLNIVDVIGQYVRLKRQSNGRYAGLCPFHSEKTPSFYVHETHQFYKCFACEVAGDVFKFVMEHDHLTFPETLKVLAERYGIPMPERQRFDDPEARLRAALLEMHEIAADVFQSNLRGPNGKEVRDYLQSRGVSEAACAEFRLGLSDGSGQQLVQRLQKFGAGFLGDSGLVSKRQSGGFYDTFRNRLMFPIHNEAGKVIGFGGRALRADEERKYINSTETAIYKKKYVLYNLHRAKIDARKNDRMVLVEGYMDVIGVYSAGIHEVVASSGTALSTEQIQTIKRQVSHQQANRGQVILNFDPDAAGIRSTEKYIGALLAEGIRVKVLRIPNGLDPDEYIQQHGPDAYSRLLDDAESFFHWLAGRAREKFDMGTAEGRADAFKYIAPALQYISDRVERSAISSELAEYLNVDRQTIRENLARPKAVQPTRQHNLPAAIPPNDKLLLACLLTSHDARLAIKQYLLQSNTLPLLELRSIFEAVLAADETDSGFSIERVSERLDDRMRKILADLTFSDLAITEENAPQMALSCLRALEAKGLDKTREEIRRQIRELEGAGKLEEALRLADELNRMNRLSAGA